MKWFEIVKEIVQGRQVGSVDLKEAIGGTVLALAEREMLEEALLVEQDFDGGTCKQCGAPYKEVRVQNKFVEFSYWEPSCRCFPVCPICGRSLHYEGTFGPFFCRNCGPFPCFSVSEKTEWNESTGKREKKRSRCKGSLRIYGRDWQCSECGAIYTTKELYNTFHPGTPDWI